MSRRSCGWLVSCLILAGLPAGAQIPTLINYQGRLTSGTNLYNGAAQFVFRVYDHPTNTIMLYFQDTDTVSVVDGLYSTFIGDEGAANDLSWLSMNTAGFWLEVAVNGTALRPRERLVSVPYARLAGGVTNGAIGTMMIADGAVMGYHLNANAVDSSKIQDGSVSFADVNQNSAAAGQVMKWNGSAWVAANDLTGGGGALASYAESGTFSPSPQAIGIESIAQGRGTRAEGENSVVGGGFSNTVGYGAHYAVIGGGERNFIGDTAYDSTIAGGYRGTIFAGSRYSSIGGGFLNEIYGGASYATIAGGYQNDIRDNADYGFIGGGFGNEVGLDAFYSAVVGGYGNEIYTNATHAFIGGGLYNHVSSDAHYAVIPGGYSNLAGSAASFAAGREAQALHAGAFVWNGSTSSGFASSAEGQFLVNAPGGVGIGAAAPRGALEVSGRTFTRGLTIEDEAFVTVTTSSNELENGLNLLAAYALARTAAPYGQPLSSSNRMAVLVPPGRYNLGSSSLALDTECVDLVGLSPAREEQLVFGDGGEDGVLYQTANDVQIQNLHVACVRSGGGTRVAYRPDSDLALTVARNCRFSGEGGSGDPMPWSRTYAGTYVDCVSGDASFGSGEDGAAAGTFIRCEAGEDSFGGYRGLASGTFMDCSGGSASFGGFSGAASGLFVRCRGGVFSFAGGSGGKAAGRFEECVSEGWSFGGGGGEASGVFIGCVGGQGSFGSGNPGSGVASGYFLNCQGGDSSFGSHYGSDASGTFIHCVGGALSFACDGQCSGVFIHCAAGSFSFGGNQDGTLSGSLYHCVMTGSEWEAPSVPSKITGRLENCSWGAGVTIQDGARLYGSTFLGTVSGDGSGNCRLAQVRCQVLNLGSLTNLINTPGNVVDWNLD